MLAMTISLLFAVAAMAAVAVIYRSLLTGSSRARLILAELAELEECVIATRRRAEAPLRPLFAAA